MCQKIQNPVSWIISISKGRGITRGATLIDQQNYSGPAHQSTGQLSDTCFLITAEESRQRLPRLHGSDCISQAHSTYRSAPNSHYHWLAAASTECLLFLVIDIHICDYDVYRIPRDTHSCQYSDYSEGIFILMTNYFLLSSNSEV